MRRIGFRSLTAGNALVLFHAGDSGYTPLIYAAREGHVDAVRLLLQSGESCNMHPRYAWNIRKCAAAAIVLHIRQVATVNLALTWRRR